MGANAGFRQSWNRQRSSSVLSLRGRSMMSYGHRTVVLLVLLGLLAACGHSDAPGAARPAPSSQPVAPPTEPAALPASSAPAEAADSAVSPSITTPTQQAIPTLQHAISEPAPSQPLSTLAAAQPTAAPRTPGLITFTDQGRTIQLAVGETFKLQLGTRRTWTVQIADDRVLEQISAPDAGSAVQGVFRARAPGQTALEAEGEPTCRAANPPCMLPTIQFSATIIVR